MKTKGNKAWSWSHVVSPSFSLDAFRSDRGNAMLKEGKFGPGDLNICNRRLFLISYFFFSLGSSLLLFLFFSFCSFCLVQCFHQFIYFYLEHCNYNPSQELIQHFSVIHLKIGYTHLKYYTRNIQVRRY